MKCFTALFGMVTVVVSDSSSRFQEEGFILNSLVWAHPLFWPDRFFSRCCSLQCPGQTPSQGTIFCL